MERPKIPKSRLYVLLSIIVVISALFLSPTLRSSAAKLLRILKDSEALQEYIKQKGAKAPLIFIFVQSLQVILAPIPGNVSTLVGGLLFGTLFGFLYGSLGIIIGSTAAFYIARYLGRPFVIKITGKKNFEKYNSILTKKSRVALFLIFLFPFFPDDILCFLSGISSLRYLNFMLLVILGRLPGVLVTCYVGSGTINIPVWGWIIIGAVSLSLIYFSARYGDKLEEFLLSKLKRRFK